MDKHKYILIQLIKYDLSKRGWAHDNKFIIVGTELTIEIVKLYIKNYNLLSR
jgi:hypothetical protein